MSDDVKARIEATIQSGPVVIFMKGSPSLPQCGFSATAAECLKRAGAEKLVHFDVLSDPAVRQGIKEYTGWPTIPQIFLRGEFIGGCDIVREMYESGELQKRIAEVQAAAES